MTFADRSEGAMTALLDKVVEQLNGADAWAKMTAFTKYRVKSELLPIIGACVDVLDEEKPAVWDEGYSFAFWQERGYSTAEAQTKGVPDHLTGELGLTERPGWWEDDERCWNPYRGDTDA